MYFPCWPTIFILIKVRFLPEDYTAPFWKILKILQQDLKYFT